MDSRVTHCYSDRIKNVCKQNSSDQHATDSLIHDIAKLQNYSVYIDGWVIKQFLEPKQQTLMATDL